MPISVGDQTGVVSVAPNIRHAEAIVSMLSALSLAVSFKTENFLLLE